MNKPRTILAAVAVLAVGAGIIASETSKAGGKRLGQTIYTRLVASENVCTVPVSPATLLPQFEGQPTIGNTFATTTTGPCPAAVNIYQGQ
jgi:hypothetical protein